MKSFLGNVIFKPLHSNDSEKKNRNIAKIKLQDSALNIEEQRNNDVTQEIISYFDFLNPQHTLFCSIGTRTGSDELIFSKHVKHLHLIEPNRFNFERLSKNFQETSNASLYNDIMQNITLPEKMDIIYISNCALAPPEKGIYEGFFNFFERNLKPDGMVIFHEIGGDRFPYVLRTKFYMKQLLKSNRLSSMSLDYYVPQFFFDYFSICDKKLHNVEYAKIRQSMIILYSKKSFETSLFKRYTQKYYRQLIKDNQIIDYYSCNIFKKTICLLSLFLYIMKHMFSFQKRYIIKTLLYNIQIIFRG